MLSAYLMLRAYLSVHVSSLLFKPRKTRIEGFIPLTQSLSLIGDINPRTTSSGVDSHAYALPQDADEGLRALAEEFLNEIVTVISHPRLYVEGVEKWLLLLEFLPDVKRPQLDPQHTRHRSYPQRFERLIENFWASIRTANAQVPPTSGGEGQPSTVRTLEFIDLVTSPNNELEPDTPPEQHLRPQDADSEAAPSVKPTTYLP
ncbi:hypothetical protein BWQ96_09185 [Gracilariopsis chorda]|uniref:Uncharacterized protein n=1 Tax=Gracilariopsis chorda TaxID=448386 RepID=A0A2V3IG87_9FLOR|nr:hypothetical protein BWQ96_09185 [Gracilariopsis chorda]|eukprot:PXF41081.1 hypothetical protein BWQ96_09185 [Gracilariopsis chorda]